jgi:hypothetical protein
MADADRLAAALRYQQDQAMPSPLAAAIQSPEYIGGALRDPQFYGDIGRRLSGLLKGGLQDILPTGAGPIMAKQGYEADPNYMQKMNDVGLAGMTVFHGSPYKFDKFDMSKIGTGEGAQAYGHGLYLAEAKGVGTEYARALGPKTAMSDPEYVAAQARLGKFEDAVSRRYKQDALSPMEDIAFYSEKYPKRVISAADKIQAAEQAAYDKAKKGYLYKVDLPDEHIAKMLDWDKPLSQQSPEVQAAARKRLEELRAMGGSIPKDPTGEWIHKAFGPQGAEKAIDGLYGQSAASVRLREAGIPGIRYLDQGSRAGGAGTSNFVVFDPAHMNIIGRE